MSTPMKIGLSRDGTGGSGNGRGLRTMAAFVLPVFLVAVVLFAASGCGKSDSKLEEQPGDASTQEEAAMDSARADFIEHYRPEGRILLIEFGLVGCELSDTGLDGMAQLHLDDAIPGLSYVRVELSKDAAATDEYYASKSLKLPVHRDPEAQLAKAFEATAHPTFVIVGKFGRVRYRGRYPDDKLKEWVAGLQAEQADPGPGLALLGTVKLDVPKLLAETKLPSLTGEPKVLDGLMGGEGLLVMFVDTTCPFSGQALGDIPSVAGTLSALKINSVLVNLDDSEETVKEYFAGRKTGAPLLYDVTTGTRKRWGVRSVPTVIFVSSDKKIGYNGNAVWATVATAIEKSRGMKAGTIQFSAEGTEFG